MSTTVRSRDSFWPNLWVMAFPAGFLVVFAFVWHRRGNPGGVLLPLVLSPLILVAFLACMTRVVVSDDGVSFRSLVPLVRPRDIPWSKITEIKLSGWPARSIHIWVDGKWLPYIIRVDMICGFDRLYSVLCERLRGAAEARVRT